MGAPPQLSSPSVGCKGWELHKPQGRIRENTDQCRRTAPRHTDVEQESCNPAYSNQSGFDPDCRLNRHDNYSQFSKR
jgi:hypothetical protein